MDKCNIDKCNIDKCNECIICFESINPRKRFIRCNICNVKGHSKCFKRWWKISKNNKCVICQQDKCLVEKNVKNKCFNWCFGFSRNDYMLLNS